ncbi:hypothetical protein BD408DRAFT_415788 [Parasitella parasitica]|nr:hypothetical protein BD408DRAFT_415788 [Parasitella parasitica]
MQCLIVFGLKPTSFVVAFPYQHQQYPYNMSYGGYGNMYPSMYGQQMISNYPANAYYANPMNPYAATGMGYYPNYSAYGNAYSGYGSYYPSYQYKPSTFRAIYNRIRHGSSYPNYYDYGRHHRGSWIDYS